jgi:N-acyl-D-aspartate/D-glutamate deacylase/CubicO group peptidase (beta-lactamase class C family)
MKPRAFLPALLMLSLPLFAQDYSAFRSYYRDQLIKNKIVGSSVFILKDGMPVWKDFYGFANIAKQQSIDEGSIYHWASITKTLTGIAVMQLRDRGLLKLDDAAVKYLPELRKIHDPNDWVGKITIRTLLNHSSGLRGATWPWKDQDWQPHEPQTWDQLVAMFPYTNIEFEPGSKWSYSNPGIVLLGRIIEVLTLEDFEYYMQKNVLRPLGMTESYYDFAPPQLLSRVCQSYYSDGRDSLVPAIFNLNTGITVSNGGLMAPFTDMAKYVSFLVGTMDPEQSKWVLRKESFEEMLRETIPMKEDVPPEVSHYGMGLTWFLEDIDGLHVAGHSGSQNAFHTHLYFDPDTHWAYLIGYTTSGPDSRVMDDLIKRYIFKNIFPKPELDVLVKNATVIDGTGSKGYRADIGIRGDRIIRIEPDIKLKANKIIDAQGKVAAPGFIDIHTHCDEGLDRKETRGNLNYLMQGTTSVVTGNCGDGTGDTGKFAALLETQGIGTNALPLTGFGWIRMKVMGRDDRSPEPGELRQMKDILKKSMVEGSWGFSTGLQYVPQKYAKTDEIIELAGVMRETGGIYATHMRSEEDDLVQATLEAIRIAREAGVPLNIAHLKANGRNNWSAMPEVLRLIGEARDGGMSVTADMYPYDKSATTPLWTVLLAPPELGVATITDMQAALRDAVKREAIRKLTEKGRAGETNWVAKGGWNYFSIVNAPNHPELANRMFIDLAKEKETSPFDVAAELVISEGEDIIISLSTMTEENLKLQMVQPWLMFSSDGYAVNPSDKGVHPRNYGSQARVIRKYVREDSVLSLEEAIYKMTGLPSSTIGLKDRGLIRIGWKADLAIFDPTKVNDPATYLDPHRFAEGVDAVVLNGRPVVENGKFTGVYAGRVVRR